MSLRLKFGFIISLIVLVASICGASFIYHKKSQSAEEQARQRANRISSLLSQTVSQSVANFDLQTMEEHLSSAVNDPEIIGVKILDPKGESIAEKSSQRIEADPWKIQTTITKEKEDIGKLILLFSSSQFKSELVDTLKFSVFLGLGTTLFIVFASFLLFRALVDTRLRRIEHVTEKIEGGETTARVAPQGKDEIGRLASKFNSMLDEVEKSKSSLEQANLSLENKVNIRTQEIRTIVDNVKAGFFIINKDLLIQSGYTKSCAHLVGNQFKVGVPVVEAMGFSVQLQETVPFLILQVFEDILPEDMSLEQLPNRVEINGKTIAMEGSALRNSNSEVEAILFTLTEVTQLAEAEQEMKRHNAIINILSQREAFLSFLAESRQCIVRGREFAKSRNTIGVRAILHTLKGNSAVYGLSDIAQLVHVMEDQENFVVEDFKKIEEQFRSFLSANSSVLKVAFEESSEPVLEVAQSKLGKLSQILADDASRETMVASVLSWIQEVNLRSSSEMLGPIQEFTEKLSARLGKKVQFEFSGGDVRMDPAHWREILGNAIHVIRNSMDHGIEAPWDRGGKNEIGRLWISVKQDSSDSILEIGDDGRGVAVSKVVEVAVRKGLIDKRKVEQLSEQEKLMLVFEESISTAESITDISGRGIGMSAMKKAVEAAGGSIKINSLPNKGTIITIKVPLSQPVALDVPIRKAS